MLNKRIYREHPKHELDRLIQANITTIYMLQNHGTYIIQIHIRVLREARCTYNTLAWVQNWILIETHLIATLHYLMQNIDKTS